MANPGLAHSSGEVLGGVAGPQSNRMRSLKSIPEYGSIPRDGTEIPWPTKATVPVVVPGLGGRKVAAKSRGDEKRRPPTSTNDFDVSTSYTERVNDWRKLPESPPGRSPSR
jgi:hypothetical protein